MNLSGAYVWLDMIKKDLKNDCVMDSMIIAIEISQKLIMEKLTGIADESINE